MIDAPEGSAIDSFSSHLQHLDVLSMKFDVHHGFQESSFGGFSAATLPSMQVLTYLTGWLSVENLQQLGQLTRLQQLSIAVPIRMLSQHNMAIGPSSVPRLVFPTSLTYLGIGSRAEAGVLSLVPTGLRDLWLDEVAEGPAERPGSLLSCMSRLQHLTQLSLKCSGSLNWPPASRAYSALTASSHLVEVGLYDFRPPQGVWPHVFPAGRKQPHLTCLSLSHLGGDEVDMALWGATDLSSLVSCCPNMGDLTGITLQYGSHVSELQQLAALTKLHAHYPPND
jgi:hypothetical protein